MLKISQIFQAVKNMTRRVSSGFLTGTMTKRRGSIGHPDIRTRHDSQSSAMRRKSITEEYPKPSVLGGRKFSSLFALFIFFFVCLFNYLFSLALHPVTLAPYRLRQ